MSDLINEHDMTKKMLDTMRYPKKVNVIPEQHLTENDITRRMLDVASRSRLITEDMHEEDVDRANDDEVIDLTGQELENEKESFRQNVDTSTEFTVCKVYPESKNVIFAGKLDVGIEWEYDYKEMEGPFMTASDIQLTTSNIETLRKLGLYFVNWREDWATRLSKEYRAKEGGDTI